MKPLDHCGQGVSVGGGGGTASFHIFRYGLDYAFIRSLLDRMRSVLSDSLTLALLIALDFLSSAIFIVRPCTSPEGEGMKKFGS
jgi:hypothetical protein